MKNNKKKGLNSPSMSIAMTPTPEQIEKFKKKIRFGGPDECWIWTAARNKDGYGQFGCLRANSTSRMALAHRLAHVIFRNTQPLEKVVRHMCRNPSCVNPDHLLLGTQLDNFNDAVKDGSLGRGEDHLNSKLTWSDVAEIRRAYKAKEMNQYELAQKFGVGHATISRIVRNETWLDDSCQPPEKSFVHLTDAEKQKIRQLQALGKSINQIAKETGRSWKAVNRCLKK